MDHDENHADWSPQDIAWDGLTLTAQNSSGGDANVPSIERYYIKGRGTASSGGTGGTVSSGCRVPGCTSDLSRDLAYFRKYRICREHLKSPVLLVEGVPSRFCQQCSRFHNVKEFDGPQRTCRAMLERLRIKRNNSKTQAGGRSGSRAKNDTDASRRGGSSSRSNSTSKDAEPLKDMASGQQQQQQPFPAGLAPTDSGEGIESAAALGVAALRRNASTATASSFPGQSNQNQAHYKYSFLEQPAGHQALLQLRQRQAILQQAQGVDTRVGSGLAAAQGGPMDALPCSGDLLQLFLSQDTALTQPRRGLLGASGAAAAALARDVHMIDYDTPDRGELPDRGATAPFYRNSPYGFSSGVASATGSGGLHLGSRPSVASASAAYLDDLLLRQRQQQPAVEPLSRRERGVRLQLSGSGREDSLLLQLAIPRGYQDGGSSVPPQGRVLDLGQPPAPVEPVLNLGGRVDLSLELQLQDIYREMAISDGAAAVAAAQPPASTQQRQGHPLSSVGSGNRLLGRSSATFPPEPLLPQGHRAAAPTSLWSGKYPAVFLGQQLTRSAAASSSPAAPAVAALPGAATAPLLSQQQQQHAFNELTAAMRLPWNMWDIDMEPLPTSRGAAPALGLALEEAMSRRDPLLQIQQQQQQRQEQPLPLAESIAGTSGDGMVHQHLGSRVSGALYGSEAAIINSPTALDHLTPGGDGAAAAGHFGSSSDTVVSLPEAGDACVSWCGADDIDAALDMLMEEAGNGAVYNPGANTASLERICFKLHNLHPCDLPSDLMCAMSSWLAAARMEVVQGAVRPGCTQLILDVYANSPSPAEMELAEDDENGTAVRPDGSVSAPFAFGQPPLAKASPPPPPPGTAAAATSLMDVTIEQLKAPAAAKSTATTRVLGGLIASENELACLEAAAAAAGAEALEPMVKSTSHGRRSASESRGRFLSENETKTAHLSAYVMHDGNVHAATACFKKLLGPRAVQSMSVSISHEVLKISSRNMSRYVADVRGTVAGMDTPLLLSVSPVAVLAGVQAEVNVIGSHLAGPGRRPQVRCQGTHVPCNVVVATEGADGSVHKLSPYETPSLVTQLVANTLPGSHRAKAAADCTALDLQIKVPETAGLMMLEWEAERSCGGVAISDWLPLLSVPDAAMAVDINKLDASKGGSDKRFRSFIQDLGLVLDYVARINQRLLLPISALMTTEQDPVAGDDAIEDATQLTATGGCNTLANGGENVAGGSGGDGGDPGLLRVNGECLAWQNRSCGGGDDQRKSQMASDGLEGDADADNKDSLEHDSRVELMARPRLSKKHYTRVAILVPPLLAFAADSGMPAVISWLMDFLLEHMYFGDLAAVFQCTEAVGGPVGLPLLHRAVRSGNARAVRLLLHRAASQGLACNLAQPAGPFNITPLHLAALQPVESGMLHACGCADPAVAQLWVSVPDAAGRTPAMYLRRQLELSARGVAPATSSTTALRTVGGVIASVAGPVHPRSSTSGSTTGTAYRSWGSEEPTDGSRTVARTASSGITGVASGVSLPDATGDLPIFGDESCGFDFRIPPQNLPSSSARRTNWNGGRRDSASGVHDGDESSLLGRDLGRAPYTVEAACSPRREVAQGGGQLSEARGAATGLSVGPLAGDQQHGGPGVELGLGSVLQSVATAACDAPTEQGQENVRAPLCVLGQAQWVDCSGAVLCRAGLQVKAMELLAPVLPVAGGSGTGLHRSSTSEEVQSRTLELVGPRPKAAEGTDGGGFLGISTEDCSSIKSELRLRRKTEQAQRSWAVEGRKSSGAGGDGFGATNSGCGPPVGGECRKDIVGLTPQGVWLVNPLWMLVGVVSLMFALLAMWRLSSP